MKVCCTGRMAAVAVVVLMISSVAVAQMCPVGLARLMFTVERVSTEYFNTFINLNMKVELDVGRGKQTLTSEYHDSNACVGPEGFISCGAAWVHFYQTADLGCHSRGISTRIEITETGGMEHKLFDASEDIPWRPPVTGNGSLARQVMMGDNRRTTEIEYSYRWTNLGTLPPTPPPTLPPTPPPNPPPILLPSRSPTRHACTDGTHGCDRTEYGICEQISNTAGWRCSCASTHRCSDSKCSSCMWITISPTVTPTTSEPSTSPTSSQPTTVPSTSTPTATPSSTEPTVSPTSHSPTFPPSTSVPTATGGTWSPTASPTATMAPTYSPAVNPTGTIQVSGNNSAVTSSSEDTSESSLIMMIIIGAIVGMLLCAAVAIFLYRRASKRRASPAVTFKNPT